jgi:hypothetical protein
MKKLLRALPMLLLVGCAGMSRSCASCNAESFGADWLIAQYNYNGDQIHCWKLTGRSVSNEEGSDGIYWTSNEGHLVHIGGWYTRVQVSGGDFESAAAKNNIDLKNCH